MSPTDPTPLWLFLYAPLGLAAVLLLTGGVLALVQRLTRRRRARPIAHHNAPCQCPIYRDELPRAVCRHGHVAVIDCGLT